MVVEALSPFEKLQFDLLVIDSEFKEKSELNAKLQKTYKEKAQRGEELKRIKGSYSYRIGRMITWPARKILRRKRV